jgi:hypothetical protein
MSIPVDYMEQFIKEHPDGFAIVDLFEAFLVQQALDSGTKDHQVERDMFQLAARSGAPVGVVAGCVRAMSLTMFCLDSDKAVADVLQSFCRLVLAQREGVKELVKRLDGMGLAPTAFSS